jgi:hypothetical protein
MNCNVQSPTSLDISLQKLVKGILKACSGEIFELVIDECICQRTFHV